MANLQVDVAVANRFISSLSKSLQALCHGCMDFDSGIEIVGYININIDSGSKVDYVLNEKVLKSTTNSMTFVSNSFFAKKDVPKQTRDGACSPIPELRPQPQTPYYRGAYQGPRSSMHFSHSHNYRGSQKRAWPGMERDWRMSPKKHRGGRMGHHQGFQAVSTPQNSAHAQSPISGAQTTDSDTDFKVPMASDGNQLPDASQSAVNVKKEVMDSDNAQHEMQSETDQTSTEQSGEESLQTSQMNIKKDPDSESTQNPSEANESSSGAADADFKGTFLHPENNPNNTENNDEIGTSEGVMLDSTEHVDDPSNQNPSIITEQGDTSNISGEYGATNDSFDENVPSCSGEFGEATGDESYQSAYSDAGEGSNEGGQFEVIEIEDEDEDVQGLFGDTRENCKATKKRRYSRALKTAKKLQRKQSQDTTSQSAGDLSSSLKPRSSVEICSFCRIALPMGTTYQQHFDEVHTSDVVDSSLINPYPYSCGICLKTFVTKERLRQHSTVHDTVLYSCFVCDVKFKHKKNIKRHIETAHGLKKCSSCMALFTKEQFDNHVLTCVNFEKGELGDFESLCTY